MLKRSDAWKRTRVRLAGEPVFRGPRFCSLTRPSLTQFQLAAATADRWRRSSLQTFPTDRWQRCRPQPFLAWLLKSLLPIQSSADRIVYSFIFTTAIHRSSPATFPDLPAPFDSLVPDHWCLTTTNTTGTTWTICTSTPVYEWCLLGLSSAPRHTPVKQGPNKPGHSSIQPLRRTSQHLRPTPAIPSTYTKTILFFLTHRR